MRSGPSLPWGVGTKGSGMRVGLVLLAALAGCATVAPAGLARSQRPADGSPACAWQDGQARVVVEAPHRRLSCRAAVRRNAVGTLRLALLADEGPLLIDVEMVDGRARVLHAATGLDEVAPRIGAAAWQVWGGTLSQAGAWYGEVLQVEDGRRIRRYGGDPLLLRRSDGPDGAVEVGDYRPWCGALLAHVVRLSGTGYSIEIRLGQPVKPPVE